MIKEKQKEVYTSPTTEVLVVQVESIVCQSINGDTQTEVFQPFDGGDL